jgi:hypothetical protein
MFNHELVTNAGTDVEDLYIVRIGKPANPRMK